MLTKLYAKTAWMFSDEGSTGVEYALLVSLIALLVAAGATTLGPAIRDLFTSVAGQL